MNDILISKAQFEELKEKIESLSLALKKGVQNNPDSFLDNDSFVALMKISKRTAQTWRDENKISFSQVGSKIYYRYADINTFLQNHYVGVKKAGKRISND